LGPVQMKDVVILGGGPGGLYTSILLKETRPSTRVRVFERNRADDTYGFGVAFHESTLRNLAEADPPSRRAIDEILIPWDDVHFLVRDVEHRVSGHGFAGCSRRLLLQVLQRRAVDLGVELDFASEAHAGQFPDADLIVAADGANSRTRDDFVTHFEPTVDLRPTRFVWLGTTKPLDAMTFAFAETPVGVFVAHAYPHTRSEGTWIVETDPETFSRAGLEIEDETSTVEFLESTFAAVLDGHPLVVNRSHWRQFPLITCRTWTRDNLVLLGDAKGTVHYSIGSGTKLAMEDALALRQALDQTADIPEALRSFEQSRRADLESLQEMGLGSMLWFEQVRMHWPMPASQFVFSGVTRKGNETYASVAAKAPGLVRDATRELGDPIYDTSESPVVLPYSRVDLQLPNRLVMDRSDGDCGLETPGLSYRSHCSPPASVLSLLLVDHADLDDAEGSLDELARQIVGAGMCGLLVDTTKVASDDGAVEEAFPPPGRWPADHGLLGLLISSPQIPTDAMPTVAAWIEAGASYVHATGPTRRATLLSDLVRHRFGVTTAVSAENVDEADTAIASGRTDLVALPQSAIRNLGMEKPSGTSSKNTSTR
jgi:2-polyprenyl-6-methoxyphenol hydroxylase-like FAD-dependent oxidoreductase